MHAIRRVRGKRTKKGVMPGSGAEFAFKLADHIGNEIVESPTNVFGHLFYLCQPLTEPGIPLPGRAPEQGGQFIQRRLHAAVEALVAPYWWVNSAPFST